MARGKEEPQMTVNHFEPLLSFDEVPQGTKIYRENDQKEVHWQYTRFILKGVLPHGLLVEDTDGNTTIIEDGFENLYIMTR